MVIIWSCRLENLSAGSLGAVVTNKLTDLSLVLLMLDGAEEQVVVAPAANVVVVPGGERACATEALRASGTLDYIRKVATQAGPCGHAQEG